MANRLLSPLGKNGTRDDNTRSRGIVPQRNLNPDKRNITAWNKLKTKSDNMWMVLSELPRRPLIKLITIKNETVAVHSSPPLLLPKRRSFIEENKNQKTEKVKLFYDKFFGNINFCFFFFLRVAKSGECQYWSNGEQSNSLHFNNHVAYMMNRSRGICRNRPLHWH